MLMALGGVLAAVAAACAATFRYLVACDNQRKLSRFIAQEYPHRM